MSTVSGFPRRRGPTVAPTLEYSPRSSLVFDDPIVLRVGHDDCRTTPPFGDVIGIVLFGEDVVLVLGAQRVVLYRAGVTVKEADPVLVLQTDYDAPVVEHLHVVEVCPITRPATALLP